MSIILDVIHYDGLKFYTREVLDADDSNTINKVAEDSLSALLWDERTGEYRSPEARHIDESIFAFIDVEILTKYTDAELKQYIKENIM